MKKYLTPLLILGILSMSTPKQVDAARLMTSGWELNSITDGMEFTSNSATVQIVTTNPRSGTYHGRVSGSSNGFWRQVVFTVDQGAPLIQCVGVLIHASVNASTQLVRWSSAANALMASATLTSSDTLVLLKANGVQIGSASAALTHDVWYTVCLKNDATAATGTLEGSLQQDGAVSATIFASGLNSAKGSSARALVGVITGTQTTADIYFDDWKINDSSGSAQTGYPGNGKVVITRPNGNGETTQWTIGGSAAAATNWQGVNEITPNEGTTLNNEALLNREDLYTVSSLGLQSYDTINLVQVGIRFNNDTADATTAFKWEIEKASGGTKSQSSSVVPNSTTWRTNTTANPDVYGLTAYTDPDGAAWVGGSGGTLDSMRIGMIAGLVGINKIQVTNIWAYVDYTPGVAPLTSFPTVQIFSSVKIGGSVQI